MRIEEDVKLDFSDVLIRPKRSTLASRAEVDLYRTITFRHAEKKWHGIPIIAANMDGVGTFAMSKTLSGHGCMTALIKHYDIEKMIEHFSQISPEQIKHCWFSMGVTSQDYDRLLKFTNSVKIEEYELKICIDVANGYSEPFAKFVNSVRNKFPKATIMAGNVVTREMTEELILRGADIVKVGIGPGSVCTTRKITGVGYPQLSAVAECADAAHGLGGQICADGGCKVPGDIAKAFGAGGDFVMLGGMLAGHDESEQPKIEKNGKAYISFYGMSSFDAQKKHNGEIKTYRASEGKKVEVPYRGPVNNSLQQILGGIRSACTYVGAKRLKDLPKCTTFIRVNRQLNTVFGNE